MKYILILKRHSCNGPFSKVLDGFGVGVEFFQVGENAHFFMKNDCSTGTLSFNSPSFTLSLFKYYDDSFTWTAKAPKVKVRWGGNKIGKKSGPRVWRVPTNRSPDFWIFAFHILAVPSPLLKQIFSRKKAHTWFYHTFPPRYLAGLSRFQRDYLLFHYHRQT